MMVESVTRSATDPHRDVGHSLHRGRTPDQAPPTGHPAVTPGYPCTRTVHAYCIAPPPPRAHRAVVTVNGMRTLYPALEPMRTGMLDVGDGQSVYWEECGAPGGRPVVFLHG